MTTYTWDEFARLAGLEDTEDCEVARVLDGLPPLVTGGVWLAGGALRRTLLKQKLDSDFDLFFASEQHMVDYKAALEAKGAKLFKEDKNNIAYDIEIDGKSRRIQCIKVMFYEDAEKLIDTFDFTICQIAYDDTTVTVGKFTLWDIARKRLAVHEITHHVSSLRRLLKYASQGFYACTGCLTDVLLSAKGATESSIRETYYVD